MLISSERLDVFECLNHKWLEADTTSSTTTSTITTTTTLSSSSSPSSPTPVVQEILPQILSVQTSNRNAVETLQFESNAFETLNSCKTSFTAAKLINEKKVDEEDDKENTATTVLCGNGEEKDCNVNQQHQQHLQQHIGIMTTLTTTNSPSSTTKLVLEKSSSIHIFPDAPTTPKVSRKTPYDETLSTHVKDIVKKYQVLEQPSINNNNNMNPSCNTPSIGDKILMKDKLTCCTKYSPLCDNLECVVCHHSESLHLSTTKTTQEIEIDKGIIC